MTGSNRTIRIAAFVVIAAVVVICGYGYRMMRPIEREVSGRIVAIDAASRRAELEFAHPKTGQIIRLAGDVPPDCEVRIDGRPAELADLRPGDNVVVFGSLYRLTGSVTAKWVRATRNTATSPVATNPS